MIGRWKQEAGTDNLIPLGGEDWQEVVRDTDEREWVQGKMLGSGHPGLNARKPEPEGKSA